LIRRNVRLPLSDSLWISLENIRKRQTRSIIVVMSTALGISYLTYFLVTNLIFSTFLQGKEGAIEAYNFWLIVVSIVICAVSLINSTMIAILERYNEIGTMKCLGAPDNHIMRLLLIESALLGLGGGFIGFTFGAVTGILSCCLELGLIVLRGLPLTGFLGLSGQTMVFSVVLSIISTAYPAIRAAKLNPVEALHYDV